MIAKNLERGSSGSIFKAEQAFDELDTLQKLHKLQIGKILVLRITCSHDELEAPQTVKLSNYQTFSPQVLFLPIYVCSQEDFQLVVEPLTKWLNGYSFSVDLTTILSKLVILLVARSSGDPTAPKWTTFAGLESLTI
jgi:hypothetical protein